MKMLDTSILLNGLCKLAGNARCARCGRNGMRRPDRKNGQNQRKQPQCGLGFTKHVHSSVTPARHYRPERTKRNVCACDKMTDRGAELRSAPTQHTNTTPSRRHPSELATQVLLHKPGNALFIGLNKRLISLPLALNRHQRHTQVRLTVWAVNQWRNALFQQLARDIAAS